MAETEARGVGERVVALLLLLMMALLTISLRVEVGAGSFMLVEPAILLVSAALVTQTIQDGSWRRPRVGTLGLLFLALFGWAALVRPLGGELTRALSDVRDWMLPALLLLSLLMARRRGWITIVGLLLLVLWLTSLVGLFQAATNSFRPFASPLAFAKLGFTRPENGGFVPPSFAIGFFEHPNTFAIFMYVALMLAIGWVERQRPGWARGTLLLLPLVAALVLSYAKTSLLVAAASLAALAMVRLIRSNRRLLGMLGISGVAGIASIVVAFNTLSFSTLGTFWWRIELWDTALALVQAEPQILLFGNGMSEFAAVARYAQPHNLFVFMLLEYGVVGLGLVLILVLELVRIGWRARRDGLMVREPLLAPVWILLLGLILIGLTESLFLSITLRLLVALLLGCFAGLLRETAGKEVLPRVASTTTRAHAL